MDIEDKIRIADLRRRLSNIVKIGIVKEVDYNKAVARVSIGELTTNWLPWIIKAGEDIVWNCISVGEQVLVLSPAGDLLQAVILPSLYKTSPSFASNIINLKFKDGSFIEFDKSTGNLSADVKGNVNIKGTTITLNGNVVVNGDFSSSGTTSLGGGGAGVARIGDKVMVDPNTHQGTIQAGSSNVTAG